MIEQAVPLSSSIRIQDAGELGQGVKRISFACAHGTTSRIVLPGSAPLSETVLRDLVSAIHGVATGCQCAAAS